MPQDRRTNNGRELLLNRPCAIRANIEAEVRHFALAYVHFITAHRETTLDELVEDGTDILHVLLHVAVGEHDDVVAIRQSDVRR